MVIPKLTSIVGNAEITFPCGVLKYDPYIPLKRTLTKQTSKGSFTQVSKPYFLHGMQFIEWEIDAVTRPLASSLEAFYNLESNFIFDGIYNEKYLVEFKEFQLVPKAGYYGAKGKFRVICVQNEIDLGCEVE